MTHPIHRKPPLQIPGHRNPNLLPPLCRPQVFEAALTTALTDRTYSKPIAWNSRAAFPTPSLQGDRGTGTGSERRDYRPRGWAGGAAELLDGNGVGLQRQLEEGRRRGEEEEEHDGLAEFDFRDQYDDIA